MKEKLNKILKKFNEIDQDYLKNDFHIHSTWTDGKHSILENINYSKSLNMRAIAITDHIRESSVYFDEYDIEIKKLAKEQQFNILTGFEARIKDFSGNLDVKEYVQKSSDVRIASVHRFPFASKLFEANCFSKDAAQAIEFELCCSAIKHSDFDILGHPGGMCLKEFDDFSTEYFDQIIYLCSKHNIAFEISYAYHSKIYYNLVNLLKKHNPFVIFSSDAHAKEKIGIWHSKIKI